MTTKIIGNGRKICIVFKKKVLLPGEWQEKRKCGDANDKAKFCSKKVGEEPSPSADDNHHFPSTSSKICAFQSGHPSSSSSCSSSSSNFARHIDKSHRHKISRCSSDSSVSSTMEWSHSPCSSSSSAEDGEEEGEQCIKMHSKDLDDNDLPAAFAHARNGDRENEEDEVEMSDHEAEMMRRRKQIRIKERWQLLRYKLLTSSLTTTNDENENKMRKSGQNEEEDEWNEEQEREFVFSLL